MQHTTEEIRVCVDIGSTEHYVAAGRSNGTFLAEFPFKHTARGIALFFEKIELLAQKYQLPIVVAMEGYNGHARPIDRMVLEKGYRLFNVNNLKLARFKEIFAGPAKSDPIDAKKMLELFDLSDTLPAAKNVLQEVLPIPEENERLKRLTRRRRDLIEDKVRASNRLEADLQAVAPGLLAITGKTDNLWFLRLLTCRDDLQKLARIHATSLNSIKGVGKKYVAKILEWQANPQFGTEIAWVGQMVVADARRILALLQEIACLDKAIAELNKSVEMTRLLLTIPGFGNTCAAEFAGEIGTLTRFKSEAGLALYSGVAPLVNSSGKYHGARCARNVNYRVKSALLVVAFQQTQMDPQAKRYYDKKRGEGKTHKQAIRSFARHLVRVMWSMLRDGREYEVRAPTVEAQPQPVQIRDYFAEAVPA